MSLLENFQRLFWFASQLFNQGRREPSGASLLINNEVPVRITPNPTAWKN